MSPKNFELFSLTPEIIWTERIVSTLITLHFVIAIFWSIRRYGYGIGNRINLRSKIAKKYTQKRVSYSIIFMITICCINNIIQWLIIFGITLGQGCHIIVAISLNTWVLARLSCYYYTLTRLEVIFEDAPPSLRYTKSFMIIIRVIFLFIYLPPVISGCLPQVTLYQYLKINHRIGICEPIYELWTLIVAGMADFSVSITCFYLLYNRMNKMKSIIGNLIVSRAKNNNNNNEKKTNDLIKVQLKTMQIIRKYTILFGFTILAMWICVILMLFTPMNYLWLTVESEINVWLLILLDENYQEKYLCICKCIAMSSAE